MNHYAYFVSRQAHQWSSLWLLQYYYILPLHGFTWKTKQYQPMYEKNAIWFSDTWLSLLVWVLIICIVYLKDYVKILKCRRLVCRCFDLSTFWPIILRVMQFIDILSSVELLRCCRLITKLTNILHECLNVLDVNSTIPGSPHCN